MPKIKRLVNEMLQLFKILQFFLEFMLVFEFSIMVLIHVIIKQLIVIQNSQKYDSSL